MDKKLISLVLILLCIIWLCFEMKTLSKKSKEPFTQENVYFTREEPYNFSNLLSTLNLLKEKTKEYSSLLQNSKVQELAADYEASSNEASNEALEESSSS